MFSLEPAPRPDEFCMHEESALKVYVPDEAIERLAAIVQRTWYEFPVDAFLVLARQDLGSEELTLRTRHVARQLREALPESIPQALRILARCLPESSNRPPGAINDRQWLWPVSDFIRDYAGEHWDEAMEAIYRLAHCGKAEYAIRPMLQLFPQRTLQRLLEWCDDPSEHVRWFCSEATRLRSPWASQAGLSREQVLPLLDALKRDPSRHVQKSVANHLNQLGKTDPGWLLDLMIVWSEESDENTDWIVQHALRTLVREGNEDAMQILGYGSPELERASLSLDSAQVKMGGSLTARLDLGGELDRSGKLLVEWVMHYAREDRTTYRKVFRGKEYSVEKEQKSLDCEKTFLLSSLSPRNLFPGTHRVEVQVNGLVVAARDFELLEGEELSTVDQQAGAQPAYIIQYRPGPFHASPQAGDDRLSNAEKARGVTPAPRRSEFS